MEKSEILDAFSKAEVHFGTLWACFVVVPCDDEALNNEELMEAICKDAEEAAKNIKMICDSLINENQSPLIKCGKRFADRLNKLSDDASEVFAKLTDVKMANWKLKWCLQMNLCAIENNIREVWKETTQGNDGSQDEASTVIIDEEREKELRSLFPNNELGKRQAKIFVRGIKKIAESPKPSARKYAMLLAHTFMATPTLYNTTTFTDLCQKFQNILDVKVISYKNKPDSLAKEWLKN